MDQKQEQKKDFATIGTETFKVGASASSASTVSTSAAAKSPVGGPIGADAERIVLNIQEERQGIILDSDQRKKLEAEKNILIRLWEEANHFFLAHSKIKVKEKATFFHLLSVMVNSGIPMIRALKSLVAQMEKSPHLQSIVLELHNSIERGSSLSEAMLDYSKVFSEAEVGMIQSGEASGQLSRVLENVAQDLEKAHMIKSKVKSAMIYPAVIMVLLIVVISAMMIFVIPKLTELFSSLGTDLPLVTRIVVGTSDFMVNHWAALLIGLGVFIVVFMMFKKTDFGRYAWDDVKLHLPIFGKLLKQAYLSRFARSLSNLLDSDVSIVKTLEITANSMGSEVYRKRLLLAMEDIKQGIPLAENLSSTNLFPPMLVNMIDVGEKTAQLDEITAKVANFYESEVDTAVAGLSKIIEPVILIIIGLTVGIVVASIMFPIMKLSDLSGAL